MSPVALILALNTLEPAMAALPEVAVVGLHVPNATPEEVAREVQILTDALADSGRVTPVPPDQLARRINGKEVLILDGAFLGSGEKKLDEGRVLYERAASDQAIPVLEKAVEYLNEGMLGGRSVRPLVDALLLLGLARLAEGEEDKAREAFTEVVILDPGLELDTVRYSPSTVEFYQGVRDGVLAQGVGKLEVDSEFTGAEVLVDGRRVGVTPVLVTDLPVGDHFVQVLGEQGRRDFAVIPIKANTRARFTTSMETRSLADPADNPKERSRQVRDFYKSLGTYAQTDLLLLGGQVSEGYAFQLYATRSGSFSKIFTAASSDDIASTVQDMLAVVNTAGDLRADRIVLDVAPLDIGANPVVADMLLNPKEEVKVEIRTEQAESRWYLWAGGAVLAAGGTTGLVLALTMKSPDQGIIVFGPLP